MNRLRRMPVSVELVKHFLMHGTRAAHVTSDALPEDAILCGVSYIDGRTIELTWHSLSFAPVENGGVIPYIVPTFEETA